MKIRYVITITFLACLFILLEFNIVTQRFPDGSEINSAIQAAGVFVALITAIIALATSDRPRKVIEVSLTYRIETEQEIGSTGKSELPDEIRNSYDQYPDPITSHKVYFTMVNNSGFTLSSPTIAFRIPLMKQHPHQWPDGAWTRFFRSNLFNSQEEFRFFQLADAMIMSNSNLPFWNSGDEFMVWIRMVLDYGTREPFEVHVSFNGDNVEGITKKMMIDPKVIQNEVV